MILIYMFCNTYLCMYFVYFSIGASKSFGFFKRSKKQKKSDRERNLIDFQKKLFLYKQNLCMLSIVLPHR